jgi:hypothetical protein
MDGIPGMARAGGRAWPRRPWAWPGFTRAREGPVAPGGSRRSGIGEKTWRNLSLEFEFRGNSDVRCRVVGPLGLVGAEKVKISLDRGPCACNQLKRFETGISNLHAGAVLAVLNDRIVQVQFVLRVGNDVVSSKGGEIKLAEDPKFPIVVWLINQRRLGKNRLEAELIAEKPDNAAARCNWRVLINSPAYCDNGKDLVFL